MIDKIINMPKIELHLHLDGSLDKEYISERYNIKIDELDKIMSVDETCTSLNDYLIKFDYPISIMQTKQELTTLTEKLCNSLLKQNVIYAEIRFAPAFHTKEGLTQSEVIESVIKGLEKTNYNLILCCMRNLDKETNLETINAAKKYLGKKVVAIDLAGAEAIFKTEDFKYIFDYAKKLNIPYTIHAGEADGPSSIKSALSFGTKRIGHGINCIYDKELIDTIISENITLEVCPTSNIDTKAVTDMRSHPIDKLYKMGVRTTINTDNSTVSNVSLNEEYINLYNAFHYTIKDFKKMNEYAIEASFLNEEDKKYLSDIINNYSEK